MSGYYRMEKTPSPLYNELRQAAFDAGISRTRAFERLIGDSVEATMATLARGQVRLATEHRNGSKQLAMVLDPDMRAQLDEAVSRMRLGTGVAGSMILAAHAGRMAEAVKDGAS